MDVSSFMGGRFLTHLDLPAQTQVWTIKDVKQRLVGADQKVCIWFHQHAKPLGLNKTNLKAAPIIVSGGYGLGSKENFQMLHELAALIGAVLTPVFVPWTPADAGHRARGRRLRGAGLRRPRPGRRRLGRVITGGPGPIAGRFR